MFAYLNNLAVIVLTVVKLGKRTISWDWVASIWNYDEIWNGWWPSSRQFNWISCHFYLVIDTDCVSDIFVCSLPKIAGWLAGMILHDILLLSLINTPPSLSYSCSCILLQFYKQSENCALRYRFQCSSWKNNPSLFFETNWHSYSSIVLNFNLKECNPYIQCTSWTLWFNSFQIKENPFHTAETLDQNELQCSEIRAMKRVKISFFLMTSYITDCLCYSSCSRTFPSYA